MAARKDNAAGSCEPLSTRTISKFGYVVCSEDAFDARPEQRDQVARWDDDRDAVTCR